MNAAAPYLALPDNACGLYVHLPYCETKCGYCDFYSVPLKDRATAPLVERVCRELERRVAATAFPIHTIFCGGGTPTILPPDQLAHVLSTIRRATADHPIVEFTVEANPDTITDEKAAILVEHGVTRVSLGAQSFFENELAVLERLHSPAQIPVALNRLRRAGLDRLNVDLIFGIPGQSLDSWSANLRQALELGVSHLSCYALTYEPATRLTAQRRAGSITPCDESLEARMYLLAVDTLADAGLVQYEISNYAGPGLECLHNLIYWRNMPYIGVGPSAAGCDNVHRYRNVPDVAAYIRMMDEQVHAESESEQLTPEAIEIELVMMQLRLCEGLSIACFRARTGTDPRERYRNQLQHMQQHELITVTDTHVALTRRGSLCADAVIRELVCANAAADIGLQIV